MLGNLKEFLTGPANPARWESKSPYPNGRKILQASELDPWSGIKTTWTRNLRGADIGRTDRLLARDGSSWERKVKAGVGRLGDVTNLNFDISESTTSSSRSLIVQIDSIDPLSVGGLRLKLKPVQDGTFVAEADFAKNGLLRQVDLANRSLDDPLEVYKERFKDLQARGLEEVFDYAVEIYQRVGRELFFPNFSGSEDSLKALSVSEGKVLNRFAKKWGEDVTEGFMESMFHDCVEGVTEEFNKHLGISLDDDIRTLIECKILNNIPDDFDPESLDASDVVLEVEEAVIKGALSDVIAGYQQSLDLWSNHTVSFQRPDRETGNWFVAATSGFPDPVLLHASVIEPDGQLQLGKRLYNLNFYGDQVDLSMTKPALIQEGQNPGLLMKGYKSVVPLSLDLESLIPQLLVSRTANSDGIFGMFESSLGEVTRLVGQRS